MPCRWPQEKIFEDLTAVPSICISAASEHAECYNHECEPVGAREIFTAMASLRDDCDTGAYAEF